MKALRINAPYQLEIVDVGIPEPSDDQVLVKVEAISICSMHEIKVYKGLYKESMWRGYPCSLGDPGHEGAGRVVKVGKNVTELKEDDRVAMTGWGGGLHAEYVLRDPHLVVKFKPQLSYEEAAFGELVACLVNAFRLAGSLLGKSTAISGLGGAGLIAVQLAKISGATEIVGIDVIDDRLELSKELGVDKVINPKDKDAFKELVASKVNTVVDCSGNPKSIQNSFQIAGEQVIIFGYTDEDFLVDQSIWFHRELVIKNAKIMGKEPMKNFETAVRLLEKGMVNVKKLTTKTMPLTDYLEALKILERKEAIKIIIAP